MLGRVAHAADGAVVANGLGGTHELLEEVAVAVGDGVAQGRGAVGDLHHEVLGELLGTEVAPVHPGALLGEDARVDHGVEALEPHAAVREAQTLVKGEALEVGTANELPRLGQLAVDWDGLGALELAERYLAAVLVAHGVAAAADGAAGAARVAHLELAVGLAGLLVELGVHKRQAAQPGAQVGVGEVLVVIGLVELAAAQVLEVLGHGEQPLGVGHRDAAGALHADGLEVLGAHDRAERAQAGDARLVAQDGGHQAQVLAGRTDGDHGGLVVAAAAQLVLGGKVVEAPEVHGAADLDHVVVDVEVDGLLGLALKDDAVVAGVLELAAEAATEGRAAEGSGVGVAQRRHGLDDGAPAVAHGARDGAGHKGQDVLGVPGADLGGALGPVDDGAQAAADRPGVEVVGVGGNLLDGAVGKVNLEQGTCVPVQRVCHGVSPQ